MSNKEVKWLLKAARSALDKQEYEEEIKHCEVSRMILSRPRREITRVCVCVCVSVQRLCYGRSADSDHSVSS